MKKSRFQTNSHNTKWINQFKPRRNIKAQCYGTKYLENILIPHLPWTEIRTSREENCSLLLWRYSCDIRLLSNPVYQHEIKLDQIYSRVLLVVRHHFHLGEEFHFSAFILSCYWRLFRGSLLLWPSESVPIISYQQNSRLGLVVFKQCFGSFHPGLKAQHRNFNNICLLNAFQGNLDM